MTLLHLLRHGAIDWPKADCFIGQTDAPLSSEGRLQANAWRNELQNVEFTAVWSSDLARATETAGIIFAGRAAGVRTCRELREIQLGEWDGLPRDRVRESHPDLWRARGEDLAGFRPPGGESFRDVQQRVVPQIAADCRGNTGDRMHCHARRSDPRADLPCAADAADESFSNPSRLRKREHHFLFTGTRRGVCPQPETVQPYPLPRRGNRRSA